MTVQELEEFLKTVEDKSKPVYFYYAEENPFVDGRGIANAFEALKDKEDTDILKASIYILIRRTVIEN